MVIYVRGVKSSHMVEYALFIAHAELCTRTVSQTIKDNSIVECVQFHGQSIQWTASLMEIGTWSIESVPQSLLIECWKTLLHDHSQMA